MIKNKTILVIGDEGFIGQHLVNALKNRGFSYIGYDLKSGNDIRNKYDLECAFENNQIRYVIHLAALAGLRRGKIFPEDYISTNILGTQYIVDMCSKYKIKKLIFYSSSAVFGTGGILPFLEDNNNNPLSLYGISKLAGEKIVDLAECPTVTIRPFTAYGENGRKDEVIYKWLEQYKNGLPITVYGDGSSCRGYVYVKDLVEATVDILEKDFTEKHEYFNLGGSEVIYLRDIIRVFKELLPDADFLKVEMPVEEVLLNYADTSKAKKAIGFDPEPNYEKNLRRIIEEFKQNATKD